MCRVESLGLGNSSMEPETLQFHSSRTTGSMISHSVCGSKEAHQVQLVNRDSSSMETMPLPDVSQQLSEYCQPMQLSVQQSLQKTRMRQSHIQERLVESRDGLYVVQLVTWLACHVMEVNCRDGQVMNKYLSS